MSGISYDGLPEQFRGSLELWVEHGISPGHFLTAVLENDLLEAVCRADPQSLAALKDIVKWVHWEAPGLCHGSPERVRAWRESHRATRRGSVLAP